MTNKILIITNKSDITSDFIVKELKFRGCDFYRFNTDELTKSVSVSLDFGIHSFEVTDHYFGKTFNLLEFNSVYFRRPELPILEIKELTVAETQFLQHEMLYTLEGIYKILNDAYWISPLYAIRQAENKIYQLLLAKEIGFSIPDSLITDEYSKVQNFLHRNSNECIVKPIKSGLIEENDGDKVVFTSRIEEASTSKESVEFCPSFFQMHIKKQADVRVTIVGNKIFAAKIDSQEFDQTKVDWRKGEMVLNHQKIELSNELKDMCVQLLRRLKLRFGAIDFVLDDDGGYTFLEINPNGQWAWIEKQTGHEISQEIVNLLLNGNFD